MMLTKEKLKLFFAGTFISVLTFFLLFAGLELFLRIFKIQSDNFLAQDPVLGWTHLSDKTGYSIGEGYKVKRRLNKDGFIGPDYDYAKPQNVYRIVIAGDSLTEAFQVEEADSYPALTEKKINDSGTAQKTEILNMGIAGYGTQRELYVLENKGLKFNPDIFVLAFFTGNDFEDNLDEIDKKAIFTAEQKFKNKIKLFLRNHFASWRFILRLKSRNNFLAYLKNNGNSEAGGSGYDPIFKKEYSGKTEKLIEKSEKLLLEFKNLADKNGKDHLVLILPSAGQVYLDGKNDYDPEKANKILKNFFEKQGINYIDLLPDLKNSYKLNSEKDLYFPLDGHPNENGHLVISNRLADYFIKLISNQNVFVKRALGLSQN